MNKIFVKRFQFCLYFRCYNCGEFANHIAVRCTLGPQPKRCHFCKSDQHLIALCPTRPISNDSRTSQSLNTGESSSCSISDSPKQERSDLQPNSEPYNSNETAEIELAELRLTNE